MYAVARLRVPSGRWEPEFPGPAFALKLPPGCVGTFLVFASLENAAAWADGDLSRIKRVQELRGEARG